MWQNCNRAKKSVLHRNSDWLQIVESFKVLEKLEKPKDAKKLSYPSNINVNESEVILQSLLDHTEANTRLTLFVGSDLARFSE